MIYNEPITIHRRGPLNVAALERSFTEVVRRHEAWRTTFEWAGAEGVQIVQSAPAHIKIPFVDLRAHPKPEEEALRLASADARQPFDFARGPMYRLRLVRLREDEHRFFITLHHIIFDGVSLYRVLLPELLNGYESFAKNESPALPELPMQYPDYAVWQRNSIREIPPEQFSFWKTALHDLPVLELKTDHARPAAQTYAGAMEVFEIAADTSAALKVLSDEQGVTLFVMMTAAFMALLQSYTGQEEIVIGGISSGRNREETANLLGCFLNTVPIRCAVPKDISFTDLLARTRNATLGALSHDEVPFELLVQKFGQNRDPSRAPLVQALIVVEPPLEPLPAGWNFTHLDVETGTAKFDLQLGLDDRADGFRGCFIYNSDLFERETIRHMRSRWLELLDRIVADPSQRLSDLDTSIRREEMPAADWNNTRTDYPRAAAIHDIFEEQARRTGDAIAVAFEDTQLRYDALNRRANQLARRLRKLGVARDVPVGVWMQRSPETIVAFLAILKSGGAYVPLDPAYPEERLTMMMMDTQMPVVLTQENIGRDRLSASHSAQLLFVDSDNFSDESDTNPGNNTRPDDLAYIMYTSGSTGTPKGVAIPHRAVVRLVKETTYASFSPNETFLQLAPISFDAATFEIWGPLLNGGKLALMPAKPPTLEQIAAAIRKHSVTTLWLTSGLFNAMVDERLDDLRPLHQLLAGGDVLSVAHVGRALRALKKTRLINGYGPTENTTFACCHTIAENTPLDRPIPIGKPIANTTAYILDENLKPVPIDATGELHIGGDGLARGYWRRDDLTAEKFVADPFSAEDDARLYKTGDLARWREDGVIEFLGRADNQIKLRGFRIEPGEIENALKQQPGVRDSAVVAREGEHGEKQLVAYVASSAAADELLAALKKSLPDYMVPAAIVTLPALPRTANGKLDRSALPTPDFAAPSPPDFFIAPKTPLEERLAKIWATVLQKEQVGREDNFFDLGGHSLAGLRVVNQLSSALGENLSPAIFLQAPTVAKMAAQLQATHPAGVARWMEMKAARSRERVRPYLGLHLELIALWEEILRVREIQIRDNFFELGGTFLMAEQMLQRAAESFGKAIPPSAFAQEPTVEHLAAELARRAREESPPLISINEKGARTPFFYLHGDLFGGGFYSLKLSRALGSEQPFYVIPPHNVRSLKQAPSVEEMAAAHLQDLRAVRPHGPYIVGGFCLGAIVAYELAQQLIAAGERVEMLLLIDAEPQDKTLRALRHASEILGRPLAWDEQTRINHFRKWWLRRAQFALWQKESAQTRSSLVIRQFRNRLGSAWNMLRKKPAHARGAEAHVRSERDVPATFLYASAGYRPRAYPGPAAVLLSEDLLHRGDHLEHAWARLAPEVSVHSLKGSHLECITAHVDTLAERIDRCLSQIAPR
ncbi:MAG: amino acid adenylation domain-containing protein [Verrucomicrobiota bacterium]|nr:amino acid adenylation domain-containing protein [Verrucomicrobiota bacterium]